MVRSECRSWPSVQRVFCVRPSSCSIFCVSRRQDMGDITVCTRHTRFMNLLGLENPTGSVSMGEETL